MSLGSRFGSRRAATGGTGVGQPPALSAEQLRADAEQARSSLPRLSLRFAIYTAIGLAFAAASILIFVRSYTIEQAEGSVRRHAHFVARAALADELRLSDFNGPVGTARRHQLDGIFSRRVLVDGTVEAELVGLDGSVTYATRHALIGRRARAAADVERTLGGTTLRSRVVKRPRGNGASEKVMEVYVPVRFDAKGLAGAFIVTHEYEPILHSVRKAYLPIAGVLELVLLALYVSFFPVLRQVTQRLRRQLHETEHQALHDGLTGLPNRLLFADRVEQALLDAQRNGGSVAVMLIDLDRFKQVNDTLGHGSGDTLLRELASRLSTSLRATDTFARLGGDEFGLVAPNASGAGLTQLIERIRQALERPFTLNGLRLEVGASIGIAKYPEDGNDVETLVKRADVAMYLAKETRAGYAFYDAEHDGNDAQRLTMATGLRRALERGELVVRFQPKIELETNEIESAEALVRWAHPERGLLLPGEFIDAAAEAGLMPSLTRHVLDTALRECSEWNEGESQVGVAVNIDVRSLLDDQLPEEIAELLNRRGVAPELLQLEITEGTVMANPEKVADVTARLTTMGVNLALDDFGTGYSSLGHLQRLPINEVKIDRSFVAGVTDDPSMKAIVRSIVALGRSLGLRVVAEGVEDAATLKTVRACGCRVAQGFHLAEPLTAAELQERLALQRTEQDAAAA